MASRNPARPNVLFVLTDDQGPWAMGCAGNAEIETPTLDRLAAEGVRFENFFCTSPVCSPARASLLTGLAPSRHGVHDWLRGGASGAGRIHFLEGRTLITDVLAQNGYRCGLIGKWHLGASDDPRPCFSEWFAHQAGMSKYFGAPFFRGTTPETVEAYVSDVLGDEGVAYLDRESRNDSPFWLSLHFTAPHSPWVDAHPADLTARYDDCAFESCPQEQRHPDSYCGNLEAEQGFAQPRESLTGYFAAVTGMDRALGRVIERLKELDLTESTLVVFLSDNGFNCGHHGIWGKGNGTFPQNMYDTSIKVPCIVSQPGRIPQGRVVDDLASGYDVFPTIVDYLDVAFECPDEMPGRSLRSLLEGGRQDADEAVVVYDEYGPVRMIRTKDWKYVHRYPYGPHLLFDLASDPGERNNVIGDPANETRLQELRARLESWFVRYADPEHDGARLPVWGRGQFDLVGPRGSGRPAFAERAPSGNFARDTYGKYVDVAEQNRRMEVDPPAATAAGNHQGRK